MRYKGYKYLMMLLAIGAVLSCRKPYSPSITASNTNYLVVEGVINSGQDSTIIKLSRTVNLKSTSTINPELNAIVTVESDQNTSYPLPEIRNGKYASPPLNLDNTRNYRLRIKTANSEYLSDFEKVKSTPLIDSLGFNIKGSGLNVYVNTHDPKNNTLYYRWDYQETWQFRAKYQSQYITDGKELVLRTRAQQVFSCFGNEISNAILLGSSAKLKQDIIYQNLIARISSTSEKLETRYSILVNQYALTKDAFVFWQNLQKNTEQLGSIFDPQPSDINGNIHCTTNQAEPVIGYISVTNVQSKRIFIDNTQLPKSWSPTYPYDCTLDSSLFCRGNSCINEVQQSLIPLGSNKLALGQITAGELPATIGYIATSVECADCTIRGTIKQPDFWR